MLLFAYATTRKGSSIKHTTSLSQSNCRNFSCSSSKTKIVFITQATEIAASKLQKLQQNSKTIAPKIASARVPKTLL